MRHVIPYIYFLRVPLFLGLLLIVFAPAAILDNTLGIDNSATRSMLLGLFDLESPGVAFATFAALLAAATCWLTSALVIEYAHLRFDVPDAHGPFGKWSVRIPVTTPRDAGPIVAALKSRAGWRTLLRQPQSIFSSLAWATHLYVIPRVTLWVGVIYGGAALSLICGIIGGSRADGWTTAFAFLIGLLAFLTVVALLVLVRNEQIFSSYVAINEAVGGLAIFRYGVLTAPPPDGGIRGLRRLVAWLSDVAVPSILRWTPEGYLDLSGHRPPLLAGHATAIAADIALIFVFAGLGGYRLLTLLGILEQHTVGELPFLPTLLYVLLLIVIACLALNAMTFFFDRFRIPILLPLIILMTANSQWEQSDHFFHVKSISGLQRVTASDALNSGKSHTAVVVCAAGGGIQAAAWTAKVLVELDRLTAASGSIRAVSTVSGGSVGAMHVLAAYQDGALPAAQYSHILRNASGSGLEQVTWGLAYPDLLKMLIPFTIPREFGRGWALERAWDRDRKLSGVFLSDWRAEVAQGKRPAALFNSTIVETGERLVFATLDLPSRTIGARTFQEVYSQGDDGALDVPVTSAARLSATFPYVTPAARANFALPRSKRYHVVDGGYYDNYGVASMVDFLDQALTPESPVRKVLVVQIRCSPQDTKPKSSSGERGFAFQATAPLGALTSVRDSAQVFRDELELRLLAISRRPQVDIRTVVFEYPKQDIPLSWHLTQSQIQDIDENWKARFEPFGELSCEVQAVKDYLGGIPAIGQEVEACRSQSTHQAKD